MKGSIEKEPFSVDDCAPTVPEAVPSVIKSVETPVSSTIIPSFPPLYSQPFAGTRPDLEVEFDSLCFLVEGCPGMLRFRLTPRNVSGAGFDEICLVLAKQDSAGQVHSRTISRLTRVREILIQLPEQSAGVHVFSLELDCRVGNTRYQFETETSVMSIRPNEAKQCAESIVMNITNNISNGNASDIRLSQNASRDLERLAESRDPLSELRKLVNGYSRAYQKLEVFEIGQSVTTPPENAARETAAIEFFGRQITLFVKSEVTFGRKSECDISLRPLAGVSQEIVDRYRRISRHHCRFEFSDRGVTVRDESTGGTFWNGQRINGTLTLPKSVQGTFSFGRCGVDAVTLAVKSFNNAFILSRTDGKPDKFVIFKGALDMGCVDTALAGISVSLTRGALEWCKDVRRGWFIPGALLCDGPARVKPELKGE
ncbi:MAG: FHA domain-containing protein [Kiritimatiellae bacterium]|nr:FHA domain-containing protein [Kiritimatiellia bacterium]